MPKAALPLNELERLAVLRECGVLDTAPEQRFDDLTELASELCGTRIALVSLIDEQRQWFKSPVTSGLSKVRGSCVASRMMSGAFVRIAWAQKADSRQVCVTPSPTVDLNH